MCRATLHHRSHSSSLCVCACGACGAVRMFNAATNVVERELLDAVRVVCACARGCRLTLSPLFLSFSRYSID